MLNIKNQHLLSFMVTEANNAVAVTNPATYPYKRATRS